MLVIRSAPAVGARAQPSPPSRWKVFGPRCRGGLLDSLPHHGTKEGSGDPGRQPISPRYQSTSSKGAYLTMVSVHLIQGGPRGSGAAAYLTIVLVNLIQGGLRGSGEGG